MNNSKSLSALSQKYRGKPKKYADGGRVRRPAAAPGASPFDPDYIERLAAQAVGAGEPVTELRSAEGRGFAPMPRSFGEAGERMSAVIRGDVEPTPEEERQINFVRGFTEGPASIRAYHGSPYAFERFDISKIGTGEGNQTYGRGLYFAENPDVARGYRDTLSKYTTALNQRIGDTNPIDLYSEIEKRAERLPTRSAQIEYDKLSALESLMQHGDVLGVREAAKAGQITPEAFAWFQKNIEPQLSREGSLYEVRLRTDPSRLLDYDIPLTQQSSSVQKGAEQAWNSGDFVRLTGNPQVPLDTLMQTQGGGLLRMMSEVDPVVAATALREAGIPGVRYLDQASRDAGRGTNNYVMFGDDLIDITRRYAEGGLAALDEKYAEGGTVRAPKETTIAGQDHKLAYITDREAALLKARGGSGRMTDYGVRAYNEGPGGEGQGGDPSDNANSNAEAATQDAAGGNTGQGAGPTGAGSGATGDPEPGPVGEDTSGEETSVTAPETAPAPNTGAFGQFGTSLGFGVVGGLAGFGLGVPGLGTIGSAIGAAVDTERANEQLGMMGLPGTVDRDTAAVNAATMGLFGQSVTDQFGQALGFDALAEAPMSAFSGPPSNPGPTADTSGGEYSHYGQPEYGTPGLSNIATSMAPATAASLVDWNQIQREASAMNMSVSDYLSLKWRSPVTMARGGMASLEQMHAKYAEGGDVRAPAGEVAEYNPEEIDRIARQIHLRFPEEDLIRPGYEDVESPSDLTMRARLMMRGQNVGLPETVGMGGGNDMFSSSTSMRDIPIESEPYGTSQRMLNTNINAVLDAERNARIGAGMLALERSGERGFTGYGPQLSAGYGPASIYGGYQAITPNIPGAKSQGSYVYGGSLNIPIDDSGTEANIGGSVMSGRRNASNTQIMGSLERPLLGGRLALELAADPSLRHKEILLGYRRAF